MNKPLLLTLALGAACVALAEPKLPEIVPVPDPSDYWKVAKYCEDAGRAYLLETDRILSLLDAAMKVEEHRNFPDRIFKMRERRERVKLMTGKDKDLKAATERYLAVVCAEDPQYADNEQRRAEYAVHQLRFLSMIRHAGSEQLPVFIDPRPQMKAIRDRLAANDRVQKEYVEQTVKYMLCQYGPHGWGDDGFDWLDESCSFEAQVKFLQDELKNPKLVSPDFVKSLLASAYERLENWDETEKIYKELSASTNLQTRCFALMDAGRYWERRAKRFYTPDWKPHLKKAIESYSQLYTCYGGNEGRWPQMSAFKDWIVLDAMRIGDYDLVEKTLKLRVRKGEVLQDEFYHWHLGQIAWAREDLDGTIEHLSQYPVEKVNKDNFAQFANLARAYDLKGEWAKELEVVEVLQKKGTGSWKDYYAYVAENLKAKLAK